jgi:DNA-binding beta-propeller fold protein YncE
VNRIAWILLILLPAALTFSLEPALAGPRDRLVIRNDTVSLVSDMRIGRFGSGELYFDDPADLAVDREENLYILDSGNYRIQVMDEDGVYLREWGKRGTAAGSFDEPVSMAIDVRDEVMFVLDAGAHRVHKFDLEGAHLATFGVRGVRKGELDEPVDLTVDTLGYVYVVDRGRDVVLKYHQSGSFIQEWGTRGPMRERLVDPVSIAYSDHLTGYILVLDIGRRELIRYKRDGEFEESITLVPDLLEENMAPLRIEADSQGDVFVLEGNKGKLIRLGMNQIHIFSFLEDKILLEKPSGLAIDEADRLYISDLRRNRVVRFEIDQQ